MQPRRLLSAMALAALLTGTVACGGDDSDDAAEAPAEEIEETEESSTDDTEASDTTDDTDGSTSLDSLEVEATVHHAGFIYTLSEASLDEDEYGAATLTVQAGVENTSEGEATPYPASSIRLGDEDGDVEVTGRGNFDNIPGKGKSKGTFTFDLDEEQVDELDLSTAQLTIGTGGEARAVVPLDGSTDDLVTLAPEAQDFTAEIVAGAITISVTETEVRWDRPDNRSQAEADTAFLVLKGTAANSGTSYTCPENGLSLTLPDGVSISPEHYDGDRTCLSRDETDRNVEIWFIIDDVDGSYEAELTLEAGGEGWGPDDTPAEAEPVTITLVKPSGASDDEEDDADASSGDEEVDVEGITDDINDALSGG